MAKTVLQGAVLQGAACLDSLDPRQFLGGKNCARRGAISSWGVSWRARKANETTQKQIYRGLGSVLTPVKRQFDVEPYIGPYPS